MTEAGSSADNRRSDINWRVSASLENVPRGDSDVAEVTNLERAVRDWTTLDPAHQDAAVLTVEHAVVLDGIARTTFDPPAISVLADRLPSAGVTEG